MKQKKLISRKKLFPFNKKFDVSEDGAHVVSLSRNGGYCAYYNPKQLTLNIINVADKTEKSFDLKSIIKHNNFDISKILWTYTNDILIKVSENVKATSFSSLTSEKSDLFKLNVSKGTFDKLSPDNVFSSSILRLSKDHPDRIVVDFFIMDKEKPRLSNEKNNLDVSKKELNDFNGEHKIFLLDLKKNTRKEINKDVAELIKSKIITSKNGSSSYSVSYFYDNNFNLKFLQLETYFLDSVIYGEKCIQVFECVKKGFEPVYSSTSTKISNSKVCGFSEDYSKLYVIDNKAKKSNFHKVYCYDINEGTKSLHMSIPNKNIKDVFFEDIENSVGKILGYISEDHKVSFKLESKPLKKMLQNISKNYKPLPERYFNFSFSNDLKNIAYPNPKKLNEYIIFNINRGEVLKFEISNKPFVRVASKIEPKIFNARDGVNLPCYVVYPKNYNKNKGAIPFVVVIHGGPWARDKFKWKPEHDFYASRGIGCVYINFRGSSGFGKEFLRAGNGEWSGKMTDDIEDVINALRKEKVMDHRVIVDGWSYGGYAVYSVLGLKPGLVCGGISGAAPSDLIKQIKSRSSESYKKYWSSIIGGNPDTNEGRKFLSRRSPVEYIDKIKQPLLVIHPKDDKVVEYSQTSLVTKKIQQINNQGEEKFYTQISISNEGHSLSSTQCKNTLYAIKELFIRKCLGTKYEPLPYWQYKESNFKVEYGAKYLPYLYKLKNNKNIVYRPLSFNIPSNIDSHIFNDIKNSLIKTKDGRRKIQKICENAVNDGIFKEIEWEKHSDNISFLPKKVVLEDKKSMSDFNKYAINYLVVNKDQAVGKHISELGRNNLL